ncbi:hypothetical protein BU25DRAFT_245896 [Macroventuria anomochaeta]|uniref:Uncharacterized protein n=1 Tax=Macroventuria anomochaeta TaxID=301207 RepID=A0ACB6SBU3_9PLEO|nr:uncharacterized protein BU25DRAFT_245896 [Macroventuria anomochaeta]KAF2630714.1 hypothetical protein BU25DRAFT_245896 [Macroventuria anomochaeta]
MGTVTLSSASNPILVLIDSTVPHLWLPRSVCDQFEQVFGLNLLNDKPSVVIVLGNDNDPDDLTQITLPFAALDLQASYPIYPKATPYFPIRRAANDTQYTLGRAFLQEAYVIAYYERSNSSVHQTVFDYQPRKLVAIYHQGYIHTNTSPTSNKSLSAGAIVGIVIGVVVGLGILSGVVWFLWRRRQRDETSPVPYPEKMDEHSVEYYQKVMRQEPLYELNHDASVQEADSESHVELETSRIHLVSDDARQSELPG